MLSVFTYSYASLKKLRQNSLVLSKRDLEQEHWSLRGIERDRKVVAMWLRETCEDISSMEVGTEMVFTMRENPSVVVVFLSFFFSKIYALGQITSLE